MLKFKRWSNITLPDDMSGKGYLVNIGSVIILCTDVECHFDMAGEAVTVFIQDDYLDTFTATPDTLVAIVEIET